MAGILLFRKKPIAFLSLFYYGSGKKESMMDHRKTVREFYHAFEQMDFESVMSHFAPNGKVHSPTLGNMEAGPFYKELFSKTTHIKITIKDLLLSAENSRVAAFVDCSWKTKSGDSLMFEGVVIFDLNSQGKIQLVRIIYDAQRARDALCMR